jgi:RHS repeat-associated protein
MRVAATLSIRRRSAAIALTFCLALMGARQAAAQDVPTVISPIRVEADHNNVNIATGKTQFNLPSLGVPAAPNLRFDWVQNSAPYMVQIIAAGGGGSLNESVSVHHGGITSESFKCVDGDCVSVTGTGSQMFATGLYLRAPGGENYNFTLVHSDVVVPGVHRTIQKYASSVNYPNGETINYTYQTGTLPGDPHGRTFYRPSRVSTNVGFHIDIAYQADGTDVTVPGWSAVRQATLYATASPTVPLQRLTYGLDGSITDIGGRTFRFAGLNNQLGLGLESVSGSETLPGEAAASRQFSQLPDKQLVSSVIKDGVVWTYTYLDPVPWFGRWAYTRVTVAGPDQYNQVYEIAYNKEQNWIREGRDSLNRVTAFGFDSAARPTLATYPEGNSVAVGYDDYGNLVSKTSKAKPGSGLADLTETTSSWFGQGICAGVLCYRPTWYRDALGRQTDFSYNDKGQLIEQLDPADAAGVRRKTFVEYTTTGISRRRVVRVCQLNVTCFTAAEIRTEYDYWGNTSLPSVERRIDDATGTVLITNYSYDPAGRTLIVDGPLPGTGDAAYFRYDVHGRKIWEIDKAGTSGVRPARRFTYRDADDRVIAVETGTVPNPTSETLTVISRVDTLYDARRNPARETTMAGATTFGVVSRSFDDRGRKVCETIRMNPAAFATPPADACQLGAQGSFGPDRVTRHDHDAASQLLKVQKAVGTPIQQDYVRYSYSLNGKQTSVTDANGNRAELIWDGHDRPRRWIFPSKTTPGQVNATDYEEYGHDAAGNRTSLRKRDGRVLTFLYDGLNRMTLKLIPDGCAPIQVGPCPPAAATRDVHYGYDVRGLQLYARFDSGAGEGVTNAYDAFGRLTASTINLGGVLRTVASRWDLASNRDRVTHPDGAYFAFGHDPAGRMVSASWSAAGGGPVTPFLSLVYDGLGRREAITRGTGGAGGAVTRSQYDGVSRLVWRKQEFTPPSGELYTTLGYNPAGQIVTQHRSNHDYVFTGSADVVRGYAVNGLNQYTQVGGVAQGHDANGNLVSDGATTFGYDAENRLISASGAKVATLGYDPLGRLWRLAGASTDTRFLYDGDQLAAEYDASGALLRRYAWGPEVDEPVLWDEGGALDCAGARLLMGDHQGSVVGLAACPGSLLTVNRYDDWGTPDAINAGRFQYTGQAWLPELGLYHYKARLYSPFLGRFLQTDPVGYDDQVNLYAYVGNDPVNGRDPTGMCGLPCKVFIDFTLELTIQVATGGQVDLGAAARETAMGLVNPLKTIERAQDAARAIRRIDRDLVSGTAQSRARGNAGTGHGARSYREAILMARSDRYEQVMINRTLRSITDGKVDSALRPDVAGLRPDGKVDITEVASARQNPTKLEQKYREALGERAGTITITRASCLGTRIC